MKAAASLGLIVAMYIIVGVFAYLTVPSSKTLMSPVVEVLLMQGHGSGVYIGHGNFVTANHVVDDEKSVSVKDDSGRVRTAEVLWTNEVYDIALLHVDDLPPMQAAVVSCGKMTMGQHVTLEGYPFLMDHTLTQGTVSDREDTETTGDTSVGSWKISRHVDATIAPGMSGGPVFDTGGFLVGINVGAIKGFPINTIVPARVICMLLARN